jgi:hypothetical protein
VSTACTAVCHSAATITEHDTAQQCMRHSLRCAISCMRADCLLHTLCFSCSQQKKCAQSARAQLIAIVPIETDSGSGAQLEHVSQEAAAEAIEHAQAFKLNRQCILCVATARPHYTWLLVLKAQLPAHTTVYQNQQLVRIAASDH